MNTIIGLVILMGIMSCLCAGTIGTFTDFPWKWLLGIGTVLCIIGEIVSFIHAKETLQK